MDQEREDLGEKRISEIGGALGEKMIAQMSRFHPRYAAYIKDNVAVLQTSPILTQRERDIIRLASLTTMGASLVQVKNTVKVTLETGVFTPEEIGEIILQTSWYCGFTPALTAAFVAMEAIDEFTANQEATQ